MGGVMTSPFVSRSEAHQKMTHHQYMDGIGYVAHSGPPELPLGRVVSSKNCAPPPGAKDGSAHLLKPPGGHPDMIMLWVAAENAWRPTHPGKGNRLAWSTDHLMRSGWEYLGPVKKKR
jgi:hypothetical protein